MHKKEYKENIDRILLISFKILFQSIRILSPLICFQNQFSNHSFAIYSKKVF